MEMTSEQEDVKAAAIQKAVDDIAQTTDAPLTTKEVQAKLDTLENKEILGAPSLMPKSMMLDASAYAKAHPDKYVRFISLMNKEKMEVRRRQGYVPVDAKEAEKHDVPARLGDRMVLVELPFEMHEASQKRHKEINKRRLEAHKSEVERVIEGVARQLRDNHQIDIDVERLMVRN